MLKYKFAFAGQLSNETVINIRSGTRINIARITFANDADTAAPRGSKNVFIVFETVSGIHLAQLFLADVLPGHHVDVDISFSLPPFSGGLHIRVIADRASPPFFVDISVARPGALCCIQ